MSRQLLRLFESRKNETFNDQKTASEIANAETTSANLAEFQEHQLSQTKRIIHGDASGNWHDDPVTVHGGDASLGGLLALWDTVLFEDDGSIVYDDSTDEILFDGLT